MKTTKIQKAQEILDKTKGMKYICRLWAGDSGNHPIEIVSGKGAPKMVGESYFHTTPGGKIVHYPNAYGYRTIYHPSTRKVEVGAEFILAKKYHPVLRVDDGVKMYSLPKLAVKEGNTKVIPGYGVGGGRIALIVSGKKTYHVRRGKISELQGEAVSFVATAKREWEKQAAIVKEDKLILKNIKNIRVNLNDSKRAGNCWSGTLTFAERRLKIPREEIIKAGYLFSVPAKKVLDNAGEQKKKAMNAIRAAWARETTICI